MRLITTSIIILIVMLIVASCTPTEMTPTVEISPTVLPNETAIIISDLNLIQFDCLKIQNDNFQTISIEGTLALVDTKNLSTTEQSLFLWDLGSGEQKVLSTSLADRYSVSPKGKLLAFDVAIFEDNLLKSRTIEIIDSHGNLLTTIDQQEEWYGFEWLGEENLLINFPIENNPLILLSPFMHEQNIIEPFSAESIRPFDHELIYTWGFYAYHKIVYNRDMTRALYLFSENGEPKIAIHNMIMNKDLVAYSTNEGWGVSPKWSPDGDKIAIGLNTNASARTNGTDKYELFVISRDGEKLYSTDLASLSESIYISTLSWSPDSRYIAFWYTANTKNINENLELAILDLDAKEITNYCITKNAEEHSWKRNDTSPIWSPDGKFLLVETNDNNQNPSAIVVDVIQGKAILVKSGVIPVGWMK